MAIVSTVPAAVVPVVAAANAVALPETGIDPTATPALTPHDAALVAEVQASVAAKAATTVADPTGATPVQAAAVAGDVQPQQAAIATEPAAAGAAEVAVELTPSQKIAAKIEAKKAQVTKLVVEIEKLEAQFRSADLLDTIKEGSVIVARVGRAETAREVTAAVVGVQTLDNGDRRLKIYFGTGFDAETVVIQDSQIIDVKSV